ncbi:MAG: hypothetical protein IPH07_09450 [Deltaproteobacteria bacterium]|nr:hypothetical protein [Deltaproteobacteria bacterium]MBK8236961.1 hypothetical protein [Deltaproteobacteria bacterium]MBK8719170.1 hypothetical protein [Deltaproteobacteria bacterium]MBP7289789.1 hypothetical protein [Nannocystaceae bacterium]
MARLSPEARAALDGFRASRSPDPGRRRRNLEATLARLDEAPVAEPVVVHPRTRWMLAFAAAVAIAIATASLLHVSVARRDDAATPTQAAAAPVATPPLPARERRPAVLPAPAATDPHPRAPAAPMIASPSSVGSRSPTRSSPRPPPAASTPTPPLAEQLFLETALLSRIRAAVDAGDDPEALALLRQHAREFPRGAMLEDREALLAIVGCRGGAATAAASAASFVRAHPRSPYAAAVRRACASMWPAAKSQ